jgi:aspartyl protease family protein
MKLFDGQAKTFIIVCLMVGFWIWFFNDAPLAYYQSRLANVTSKVTALIEQVGINLSLLGASAPEVVVINDEESCHGKPPENGKQYVFAQEAQNLKQISRLFVHNAHLYPVWVTLYDTASLEDATRFYLIPGKHSEFKLPIGEYELEVQSGRTWCNLANGFSDANYIESAQAITIKANEVSHLQLTSYGQQPAQVMITLSHSLGLFADGQQRIKGAGSLVLQRVVGGHYTVEGTINQKPVYFMVDTGATNVAVSDSFAQYAGITECRKSKVITANGIADVCVATAKELTIGQFVLNNVTVNYSKGISDDAFLLGMNVIGEFKLEQEGDTMKLSLHK